MKTRKAGLDVEAHPPEGNWIALDSVQMQGKLRQDAGSDNLKAQPSRLRQTSVKGLSRR